MPARTDPTDEAIDRAASILRAGGVVAFPTETVYGLGADTFNVAALRRVYEMKGRPADNPLIAHVLDAGMASRLTKRWDRRAAVLAERFWPGPLTLVLPRTREAPAEATAGYDTIAVRAPRHPVARLLLERFASPISAPSANRSGHVSPTRAEHVEADFANEPDLLILDGGPCELGIESTVLDLSGDVPSVLRPGSVTVSMIADVLGEPVASPATRAQDASPGTSAIHYAPRTRMLLIDQGAVADALGRLSDRAIVLTCGDRTIPSPHESITLPDDPDGYAVHLYEALRRADTRGGDLILVERPPGHDERWAAILNRLERAAARE